MIMNCISYQNGHRLGEVTLENISEVIKTPSTFIWMGLNEPDDALFIKIKEEFGLHELAIEDAKKAHQRPKIEAYGDSLFIVVKTAELHENEVQFGETHFFVGKHFLISLRHGTSIGFAPVREHCEQNPKMLSQGPAYALYALLDFIVDHYRPVMGQFEEEFDLLEADIFKGEFDRLAIGRLYDLKRRLLQMRNAALPINDICNQLVRFHSDIVHKELQLYFRDIQDHATYVISMVDTMREMLTTAMQVHLGIVAVGQNDVVKSLAGWGAILALPTLIFSLYGMNFKLMPELNWTWGYPLVLLITAGCCLGLYKRLNRAGWL